MEVHMPKPVFYDPRRSRWKRVRVFSNSLGLLVTLLIIFFVYSAVSGIRLPELFLQTQKRPYHALKEKEREKEKERRRLAARRGHRKSKIAPSQVKLNAEEGIRAAFYVDWDAASFSSLREYARQIDLLFPDWLHVLTPDGHLQGVANETNIHFDIVQGQNVRPVDDKVMPFLKAEDAEMEVFPMVNNFNGTDWVNITDFLNGEDARALFRQQVATFLATDHYRGLMIDFEDFPKKAQPGYMALLEELSSDLRAKGMKLYVSVPARNEDYDYAAVASHVDGVVLMNYDEHYPDGSAGPVASQDWFVENLKLALKKVPKDKLISAIGNYGYDWTDQPVRKKPKRPAGIHAVNVSVQDAWLASRDSEEDIDFDGDSSNPHLSYLDEQNQQHDVWFLDAVTALNEMRAAQESGIKTFALWRLGSEDRSLWKVWDLPGEAAAPDKLKDVPPGQDVDMEGQGEILKIESRPENGQRTIKVDNSGLIEDETFTALPNPYRVGRYGASRNQIAITFDDGPDPQWTPKILEVLKREHAPATFFLIGIQADKFGSITRQVYDEGHEIGNHTFTHPDIANISGRFMKLELNLTEQLFASRLGIRTILFRPPYSIDQEPDTEDQVRPLELVQDFGYITVGDKIDPNDWRDNPRRTAEQISQDVLAHLPPCALNDQRCGNILLLHDGGGNRAETVRALPMIIDGVRAKGFQIVPVYQLLGKTKADVMSPLPANERWAAHLNFVAFWLLDVGNKAITWIFFLGDLLMSARLLWVGIFAVYDRLRKQGPTLAEAAAYRPKVAVLIPAYNEEKVIERTIRSVLDSTYPKLRVIVIDDGSKDATLEVARKAFTREVDEGRVLILTKPNSGKAEALNYGLRHVHEDEELFVGIDADTVIARDAISYLVPRFLDPKVGAVAGNAKVGNRVNLWTRWQALEYITSQNFERRALNTLGAVSVVPGAIGAWRTAAVHELGGYHTDTVAEDADLTMALLESGYQVRYEDLALAFTEAPVNANGLMRQRFRWSFGILQAVWKHRGAFARKGALGWIALPNIVIFQILLPIVSPLIDLMFLVGTIWYFLQKYFHPESTDPASFQRLVVFFFAFLVIDFIASAIAFALERRRPEHREDLWLLSQVWLQRFAYRQLFSVVLLKTLKRAVEGRPFAWDKLERTAAVRYQPVTSDDSVRVP
jgi:cellulose synthase/poly-beta-1,6-N-acetylglucosamine synthase-like glycosyltransferase/peptidoglycan/xylan/chitin deacetylase (PgdA/CDA1 family)/spore germination protein YaaH